MSYSQQEDLIPSLNRRIKELEALVKMMADGLEKAYDTIHGEFCGRDHHKFCVEVTEALEACRKVIET